MAFSLILVVGAALFLRTLSGLLAKGPGFDTSSLLSFALDSAKNGYSRADASRLIRRIDEQVRALPLTRDFSHGPHLPFLTGGHWSNPVTVQTDRRFVTEGGVATSMRSAPVSSPPSAFASSPAAISTSATPVPSAKPAPAPRSSTRPSSSAIWPAAIPSGSASAGAVAPRTSRPVSKSSASSATSAIAVSARTPRKPSSRSSTGDDSWRHLLCQAFAAHRSRPFHPSASLVRQADPRLPILWFRTLDDQVNRSLTTERLLAALSSSFGALALLLSLIGLYGVMSFVVTRRTREIGIRLALGATSASAIRLVLRDAVAMIAAGMAIALPCVAALGKLVQSQLFGVTATDPATIAAAALVLAAGALAAAFIPAWRASNVSPTDALRLE